MKKEPNSCFVRPIGHITALMAALALLCTLCCSAAAPSQPAAVPAMAGGGARTLIPVGRAVGIKLFSDGVLVVGLSDLDTGSGTQSPGKSCGLKAGDIITHINGREVDTIEQVQQIIKQDGGQPLTLQASRGSRAMQLSVQPVKTAAGSYQLGVWLRDSMAGIGTMTFYDPDSGTFAALGHGINDADTAKLMPLESGSIMHASVSDVKKGAPGQPGELHGVFDLHNDMGALYANTEMGVFGTLEKDALPRDMKTLPVAAHHEIREGHATILSNVEGDSVQEYDVNITHVYSRSAGKTRNMMLEVTDPRLLSATGGIVQGMSGSPVIQNGRIVGAVTHVLINDPTKGYGIFIENMLEAAS